MATPKQVYDAYRGDPLQDMYDYSPFLRSIAKGNILEIGTRGGVSTSAFLLGVAENGGHVYSVDCDPACGELFEGHPQWTFIHGHSDHDYGFIVRTFVGHGGLDILFIDGDHNYEAVCKDIGHYVQYVKLGGLILMHDVDPQVSAEQIAAWGWIKGDPRRAFDEFTQHNPTWQSHIMPGRFGLGVIHRGG